MKKLASVLLFAGLVAGAQTAAAAQQGLALKGHYLFNESNVESSERTVPEKDGFALGAEYVLPMGLGVGVSAYTTGDVGDEDIRTRSFGVLAEVNYFFDLPIIPITPYAGVHAGLGQYRLEDEDRPELDIRDDRNELGFQVGARWQISRLVGLDARYRRVSQSAADEQSSRLERNQVLVGVTLF